MNEKETKLNNILSLVKKTAKNLSTLDSDDCEREKKELKIETR